MVQRLTYRRRHSYNTTSNGVKVVKTPGGKLVVQHRAKLAKGPSCGDCGCVIQGVRSPAIISPFQVDRDDIFTNSIFVYFHSVQVPHLRPQEYSRVPKHTRTVTRAYGGSRCAECVRNRIVRAFLIEEQKIVKSVLKTKEKEAKAVAKAEKAKKPVKP